MSPCPWIRLCISIIVFHKKLTQNTLLDFPPVLLQAQKWQPYTTLLWTGWFAATLECHTAIAHGKLEATGAQCTTRRDEYISKLMRNVCGIRAVIARKYACTTFPKKTRNPLTTFQGDQLMSYLAHTIQFLSFLSNSLMLTLSEIYYWVENRSNSVSHLSILFSRCWPEDSHQSGNKIL